MMSAAAPQTASTTSDDPSESGLPQFTTFQPADLEATWEYYDRSVVAHPVNDLSSSSNSYTRPWEMESKEHQQQQAQIHQRGFEPFPKLPSFQSQFHSFADNAMVPEPSLPAQVTAVPVPISPSSASPSNGALTQLTQLTTTPLTPLQPSLASLPHTNFHHTLTAVNVNTPRGYPLVPAPIQARDIPTIQQQYIDERHIQLYQPITTTATFHHPAPPQPLQSGVVTVLKNETVNYDLKNGLHHHNSSFQNASLMDTSNNSYMDTSNVIGTPKTSNKINMNGNTPHAKETRKKERRKIRAGSLESSTESDASSAMDIDGANGNPQVAAVSSTDNFKSPMHPGMDNGNDHSSTGEKQKQKKRKRCGECVGCQKKDNCGECAPCRNDKSHQICKLRRCEKLTEKKIIYSADGTILRGESRRGRGKGRGGGMMKNLPPTMREGKKAKTSGRGRKALNLGGVVSPRNSVKNQQQASSSPAPAAVPQPSPNQASASQNTPTNQHQTNLIGVAATQITAQQPHQQQQQANIQQIPSSTAQTMKEQPQQPMTPMAFYPTWQTATAATATTDPSQTWQNQFIQQIPSQNGGTTASVATAIAPLNSLDFQPQGYAYPNGYVQTTGLQFDPNSPYSRTATTAYSSPAIQRYEFQAQQITPINQVSLQSVSFGPNVTAYSQIASPTVLLNHQQHHSHYAAHQQPSHLDQLNNKQMTMSLTTSSGNEMPGYPRVNSVPPRSLNCNGYPGLVEYGGNSINTTANNQSITNTSTASSNQMQPPASSNVTQSPSRQQPSRPNSSSNHLYQQQSPSHYNNNNNNNNNNGIHMSPTSQAQSPSSHHHGGSTTPNNNQHYPTSGMITPTSHHQQIQDGNQDWNQNAWNGSQHGEMFNQSDRINLNTRLKTMILNKNDKDQQQQQQTSASTSSTGHFLSYSHQHLQSSTEQPQQQQISSDNLSNNSSNNNNLPLSSNNNNNNNNNSIESKITDAGDDGGFKMNDSWKSSIIKQEHSKQQQQDFFEHKQQLNEKNIGIDPGGGNIQEESSNSNSKEPKAIDNYSSNNNGNNNDNNQHTYPSGGSSGGNNEDFSATLPKIEKISSHENNNEHEKHSYAYNSAHEYQQHQNMVNNIKKEIGSDETTPNIKFDGYEKNYQNFIRYADFCDAQQPGQYQDHQKQQSQYQQDYIQHQSQGYSAYNYPYQNYPHHPSQNYPQPHAQNAYQPFMSQQAAYQQHGHHPHHSTSLTNFEQQIPLHTYPIPKHSSSNPTSIPSLPSISSSKHGHESIHPSATPPIIKTEQSNSLHPYPFLSENMAAAAAAAASSGINKDNSSIGQHYSSSRPINPINEVPIENSCNTTPTKEQSIKEEVTEEETTPVSEVKIATNQKSTSSSTSSRSKKQAVRDMYNERNNKPEVPECDCFSSDKKPPEPGSYYTHLGCASTVAELRKEIEQRAGLTGKQLRIEKVLYTGKEGKSTQGCPTAKWVIRRVEPEEKALFIVKRRQGHRCKAAFIVISIVVWDALPLIEADNMYKLLVHKLNKFGLPTTRRCATNENRTCACQGLDPETCGASYSFGCSWSMYYNGCKYARSKTVRKFRLSVKSEEAEIEERMNILATILSPLYKTIAPKAYDNQVQYEVEAPDCRLGLKTGKPFSGVTCCVDFCAHTHRDLHNMQDGCTVQATLLKPRPYGMAPEDEQLHVLPLYTMDGTDEFDSEEGQKKKHDTGAVQVLEKYPTEVRVRSTPLQPCRRHGKKRGNEKDPEGNETPSAQQISQPLTPVQVTQPIIQTPPPTMPPTSKDSKSKSRSRKSSTSRSQTPVNQTQLTPQPPTIPSQNNQGQSAFSTPTHPQQQAVNNNQQQQQTQIPGNGSNTSTLLDMASMIDNFTDAQLQSNQISSTVLDSPYSYDYQTGQYIDNRQYHYQWQQDYNKLRGEEISPDTTTRPGSSNSSTNSSSAFSPNIQQQSQGLYESNNNSLTNGLIKDEYSKGQQYHQLETAFVKPKAPEYNPQGYGNYTPHQPVPQHPNNYIGYSAYPYDPYAYNSYSNYSSNYPSYNMGYGQPTAQSNWGLYPQTSPMGPTATPVIPAHFPPQTALGPPTAMNPPPQKITEVIGEVTEVNDNLECFQDKQMGGVAVALPHGSVVIECAKLEMHSTTALKKPNRLNPNRISLIFYQHRNLNRPKHGTCEWAEKMRLKKLGITTPENDPDLRELLEEDDMKQEFMDEEDDLPPVMPAKPAKRSRSRKDKHASHNSEDKMISSTFSPKTKAESKGKSHPHNKANTLTTTSWTTLFPMHPCVVTGPYHENSPTQQLKSPSSPSCDAIQDPLALSTSPPEHHNTST